MKHLSDAPLKGRLLTLPTNIRQGCEGLPGTNALTYYKKIINYDCKKFYNIDNKPLVVKIQIYFQMLYIFEVQLKTRHLWLFKIVIFLHRCQILTVLLMDIESL